MKPHRVRMAHNLIVTYGLYKDMEIFRPELVTQAELTRFHSDDYVDFLRLVTPDNMEDYTRQLQRCKCVLLDKRPFFNFCGYLTFADEYCCVLVVVV